VSTIAGLLKLYFRTLDPPIFPFAKFNSFMETADKYVEAKDVGVCLVCYVVLFLFFLRFVSCLLLVFVLLMFKLLKNIVNDLPKPSIEALKVLFTFLRELGKHRYGDVCESFFFVIYMYIIFLSIVFYLHIVYLLAMSTRWT
jgi:hypothetical protein